MLIIRSPESQLEYRKACEFIESAYKEHGYVEFLRGNPSQLLLAVKNVAGDENIKGAIGIALDSGENFPTEHFYNFDIQAILPDIDRSKVFEISRLASQSTLSLVSLMAAVGRYAKDFDFEYAMACVKPKLLRFLEQSLKINAYKIEADVCPERIPEEYYGYFLSEPAPIAIYFVVPEVTARINKLMGKLGDSVKISLDALPCLSEQTIFCNLPHS